jgi:hypothetical protein
MISEWDTTRSASIIATEPSPRPKRGTPAFNLCSVRTGSRRPSASMNATTPTTWTQPANSTPKAGPATENSNAPLKSYRNKQPKDGKNGMMEDWNIGNNPSL